MGQLFLAQGKKKLKHPGVDTERRTSKIKSSSLFISIYFGIMTQKWTSFVLKSNRIYCGILYANCFESTEFVTFIV
jgi:hypothetical protein